MAAKDLPKGNAAIGQSGGPTAVINQSLVGAILALRKVPAVKRIYGMRHGVNGLVRDQLVDMTRMPDSKLEAIAATPSAALGSSRDKPDPDYCAQILQACTKHNIKYFFYIGGNDSSDTCRIVSELSRQAGYDMRCFHIPKTVDNDLVGSDHTPGYPSAARFQALAFMSDSLDNASLPGIKINVVMGRHAGFLTAAAALARGRGKNADRNGPHLIYVPEVPFDSERFVSDIQAVYDRLGRCQVAVSEGIQDSGGRPIAATLGDALADQARKRVKTSSGKAPRVRADTFGYLQRCWPDPSPIDQKEARAAARFAVRCAARGDLSGSVAIRRAKGKAYKAEYVGIELSDVAAKTRHMPPEFIDGHNNVTRAFLDYAEPLVGELPEMARL